MVLFLVYLGCNSQQCRTQLAPTFPANVTVGCRRSSQLCEAALFRGYVNELLTEINTEHQVLLYKTLNVPVISIS